MYYFCCDKNRRDAVIASDLNGIDFVEVLDDPSLPTAQRQRTLFVHFLKDLAGPAFTVDNFLIEGGERIRDVLVTAVNAGVEPNILDLEVDKAGDFSIYTLRLVAAPDDPDPPDGIDPMSAFVDFSFKVECPNDFDCKPVRQCPPRTVPRPPINYLAKDYASFRRLMLDRMALLAPQWKDRHVPDMALALVELLAYVGDHLSYQQDAVATEAYLDTARSRVSVRRHARLVDYLMHDGRNARTWVHVQVDADNVSLDREFMHDGSPFVTKFLSRLDDHGTVIEPGTEDYRKALRQRPLVFEPLENALLFSSHNEMHFYTWSDQECCLPAGATRATLRERFTDLSTGDVLIFEEVLGPLTGDPGDADLAHRHAVRLTQVVIEDAGGDPLIDPVTGQEITAIEWDAMDALPFPLCISARTDEDHGAVFVDNVSVARGNIVLCDHGITVNELFTDPVPEFKLFLAPPVDDDHCNRTAPRPIPPRYRPRLQAGPLSQVAPYDATKPAAAAFDWSMREVMPQIGLVGTHDGETADWEPRRDLLNSFPFSEHFVAEVENDGSARLRFGDDIHGRRPEPGTGFSATYRVGNGTVGNLGADSIAHIVTTQTNIVGVRNPQAGRGGGPAESMTDVRRFAPQAFRVQERAVTPEDYSEVTERMPDIQKAQATFRWTGSWHTVFLTVDRELGLLVDEDFEAQARAHVERYRMAGHDLEVDAPRFVSLEIDMQVCAHPDYFRSEVKRALLDVFSNRDLPDGRRGVFHPDNFTFGQTVYLSPLYAAAQSVPGVSSVHITLFQRQGEADDAPLEEAKLEMDRLEIARLDNDQNFPERGVFRLEVGGGK